MKINLTAAQAQIIDNALCDYERAIHHFWPLDIQSKQRNKNLKQIQQNGTFSAW